MRQIPRWTRSISLAVVFVMVFGVLSGCSSPFADEHRVSEPEEIADSPQPDEAREAAETASDVSLTDKQAAAQEQKIIRNARVNLEVESPEEVSAALEELADEIGGYVSEMSQRHAGDRQVVVNMTVRIPAEKFSDYYSEVTATGVVTDSRVWTTDVTEEYMDVQARLNNMKGEEEALQRLLDEAETVDEILRVRQRLADVRGRIDSLAGRLRYLTDRIDYSTFHINLQPETLAGKAIQATGFDDFWPRLAQALIRGTNLMLNAVSALVMNLAMALPSLILLAAVAAGGFLIYRKIRYGG